MEKTSIHGNSVKYPIELDYDVSDDLKRDEIQIKSATLKLDGTPVTLSGSVNAQHDPSVADLKVETGNVSIVEAGQLATAFGWALTPGMEVSGRLNVDLQAKGPIDNLALNGTVKGSNLVVSSKDVPASVKVASIDLKFTPQQVSSGDFTAVAGGTSVAARFAISQFGTKTESVDATVRTSNANLGELIDIAQAAGVGAIQGMSAKGAVSLELHVVAATKKAESLQMNGFATLKDAVVKSLSLTQPINVKSAALKFSGNTAVLDGVQVSVGSMNINGSASVRNFSAPQVQFTVSADKANANELQHLITPVSSKSSAPADDATILDKMTGSGTISAAQLQYDTLAMQNVKATVTINRGVIMLNPVSAESYGGAASGSITVETRGPQTQYNLTMKAQKVDANQFLSAMSNTKSVLYGLMGGSVQTNFSSVTAGGEIAGTLNGRASLNLTDGKLMNVDVMNELATVGKFRSLGRQSQGFTKITQASGDVEIRNGVAQTNNMKAVIEGGTLSATGSANLVDESINLHMTVVLNKDYSQAVGGTGIGGLMQTALANRNGELVLPVLVTGTFQKMKFAPDIDTLARMKVQNLLPTGTGGLTGVLNSLGGKQQGTNPQQKNPTDQLLDLFGKKKQKQ
jgi:uncharacterized protein involved in outer membrane biogenesis